MASVLQLGIGEILIVQGGETLSTVLGSCIAVCIYTQGGGIAGMNHFVLPEAEGRYSPDDIYRYGIESCKAMIETILAQEGVRRDQLVAKIIGGASLQTEGLSRRIGDKNIAMARRMLAAYRIPVAREEVGGDRGRKVYFYTSSGRVRVGLLESKGEARPSVASAKPAVKTTPASIVPIQAPAKKRVLIVDDSKTIQEFLKAVFAKDPEIEVVGIANHPGEAEAILARQAVDVMTLDIQMPVMDGVTFLEQLMPKQPLPVVMLTSMSPEDGNFVLRALELGAVDYIQKPKLSDLAIIGPVICEKVKAAAAANLHKQRSLPRRTQSAGEKRTAHHHGQEIIAIGSSTGGTVALSEVLSALPANIPPIVIVQHIPPVFSKAFANRLNDICAFEVKEAEDGDELLAGRVLIAPGGKQMELVSSGGRLLVGINDSEPVNRHKPSVDYLFDTVARITKGRALGIILTGMGADGAKGLLAMREAGSHTIGQDEKSCVVYGMPKEAYKLGGVVQVASLDMIAGLIEKWMAARKSSVA